MTQLILYMNSKSANSVSVVLCIYSFRKILEHMLRHKYAVQSLIAVGREDVPYAFLKGLNFQI